MENNKEEKSLIPYVSNEELIEILKSDTVYSALRSAVKSPSRSGMDDHEDNRYIDLYDIVTKLRNG
jgi:hypothetical protein